MSIDAARLLAGASLEMTAKDLAALQDAAVSIPAGTPISITYLPHETSAARVAAAAAVRRLGFKPVPHFSARRLSSAQALEDDLAAFCEAAGLDRVFVIAGDGQAVDGPYPDSLGVIRTGLLPLYGVTTVGIAGHPQGHGHVPEPALWQTLKDKAEALREQGLKGEIVTQFAFDAEPVLAWLERLRGLGVDLPVRVGVPGPASLPTLLRFAARCGVEASARVMARYGASMGRLLGGATGPERMIAELEQALSPAVHGSVRLHVYPFGGFGRTAQWLRAHAAVPA